MKLSHFILSIICSSSVTYSAGQVSLGPRKTDWTVEEVKEWATKYKDNPGWHGKLLYRGSDSLKHHFIARIMDEWCWFNINRKELSLKEEHAYSKRSSAPLGYYYVDALKNFEWVQEY